MRTEAHFSRRGGAADSVLVAAKMRGVDVALNCQLLRSKKRALFASIAHGLDLFTNGLSDRTEE
jgi:hypothetical protein